MVRRESTVQLFDPDTHGPWSFSKQVEVAGTYPLDWDGALIGEGDERGPSRAPGFDTVFPPESGAGVDWRAFDSDEFRYFDFVEAYAETDNRVCYARVAIDAPSAMEARLSIGSNDGVKVWVNGELANEVWAGRAARPHQEIVPVRLQAGRNEILAKVANIGGGWGLFLAIEDPERILRWEAGR